jgi:hypothetical protein
LAALRLDEADPDRQLSAHRRNRGVACRWTSTQSAPDCVGLQRELHAGKLRHRYCSRSELEIETNTMMKRIATLRARALHVVVRRSDDSSPRHSMASFPRRWSNATGGNIMFSKFISLSSAAAFALAVACSNNQSAKDPSSSGTGSEYSSDGTGTSTDGTTTGSGSTGTGSGTTGSGTTGSGTTGSGTTGSGTTDSGSMGSDTMGTGGGSGTGTSTGSGASTGTNSGNRTGPSGSTSSPSGTGTTGSNR